MTQDDPIQAQLIAARRNQILDAATKVFAEKGFHRSTIKDIAKVAGIADGTIYNYFENKTALLMGLLNRLNETEDRAMNLQQATEGDLQTQMYSYLRHRFESVEAQGLDLLQVMLSELLVDAELREQYYQQILKPTYALAEGSFEKWKTEGRIKGMDTVLMTRIISGAFLGLIVMRLLGDTELQAKWNELPDAITEIILNGLIPGGNDE
jgi:TetR/AcrR family fatty acid metabolism transcriptional regulator